MLADIESFMGGTPYPCGEAFSLDPSVLSPNWHFCLLPRGEFLLSQAIYPASVQILQWAHSTVIGSARASFPEAHFACGKAA